MIAVADTPWTSPGVPVPAGGAGSEVILESRHDSRSAQRVDLMSTATAVLGRRVPRSALPVAVATATAAAIAALGQRVTASIALPLVVAAVTVFLIRVAPLKTVSALIVLRAALEGFSDHQVLNVVGIHLSPPDLVSLAFLAGGGWWLLARIASHTFTWRVPTLFPVLGLLLMASFSLLYSADWAVGARDILKFTSAYFAFLVIMQSRPTPAQLRMLLGLVVASSLLPVAIGWYQFTHSIGKPGLLHGGLRIQATFDHPNTYGFYLVSVLTAEWGLYNAVSSRRRLWVAIIGVATFISAFLTLSRNTWGAMVLLVLVIAWRRRRVLIPAVMAGGGVMLAMPRAFNAAIDLFNPRSGANRGNSLFGRLDLWSHDIATWKSSPWFGHGWGSTQAATGALSHNDYLRALGEAGIVGLLAFLVFIGSLLRSSWRAAKGRTDLPRAFLGLSLGYTVVSLASNNFGKGSFQFYFWVLAAISYLWAETFPLAGTTTVEQNGQLRSPMARPSVAARA